ncbi:hypothetical protein RvY_05406 [Ramazzottius varieornatus]|uniref:Sugar phosphate transporter domain-containing protein n=1 Tax=Ramazzottius varieornatus TaxID=947166 RepID=A0A1D1UVI8_RAMVA|nr:hypothetical protein RvY_05406 [Ramazzottius varieornatus]
MSVAMPIAAVFVSCSANVVILEQQIKLDSGSTNLITFSQFLFNAAMSFCTVMQFGRRKSVVPLRCWLVYTVVFFVQSVANNNALSYDIGVPLHMILKSSTPVVSMLLSAVSLHKRYPVSKWIAVLAITAGFRPSGLCFFSLVGKSPLFCRNRHLHSGFG